MRNVPREYVAPLDIAVALDKWWREGQAPVHASTLFDARRTWEEAVREAIGQRMTKREPGSTD